jgi:hypothetical protein
MVRIIAVTRRQRHIRITSLRGKHARQPYHRARVCRVILSTVHWSITIISRSVFSCTSVDCGIACRCQSRILTKVDKVGAARSNTPMKQPNLLLEKKKTNAEVVHKMLSKCFNYYGIIIKLPSSKEIRGAVDICLSSLSSINRGPNGDTSPSRQHKWSAPGDS